jgi:hypothetical protein
VDGAALSWTRLGARASSKAGEWTGVALQLAGTDTVRINWGWGRSGESRMLYLLESKDKSQRVVVPVYSANESATHDAETPREAELELRNALAGHHAKANYNTRPWSPAACGMVNCARETTLCMYGKPL